MSRFVWEPGDLEEADMAERATRPLRGVAHDHGEGGHYHPAHDHDGWVGRHDHLADDHWEGQHTHPDHEHEEESK